MHHLSGLTTKVNIFRDKKFFGFWIKDSELIAKQYIMFPWELKCENYWSIKSQHDHKTMGEVNAAWRHWVVFVQSSFVACCEASIGTLSGVTQACGTVLSCHQCSRPITIIITVDRGRMSRRRSFFHVSFLKTGPSQQLSSDMWHWHMSYIYIFNLFC